MPLEIPDIVIRMTEEATFLQEEGASFGFSPETMYQDVQRLQYQVGEIIMAIVRKEYINPQFNGTKQ